jgi:rhodanese-related sulfurtransferase
MEITAPELNKKVQAGQVFLLDVRQPWEHETAHIKGDTLITMNEIPSRLSELPRDRQVVAYCHSGIRSYRVAEWLRQQGFPDAVSLAGGIDAWSQLVDPTVPRY